MYFVTFYNKYLQNLKYNVKQACIFHLILVAIPSSLTLSIKWMVFFYLMDEKNVKKQCMAIIYYKQKLRVFDRDATQKKVFL